MILKRRRRVYLDNGSPPLQSNVKITPGSFAIRYLLPRFPFGLSISCVAAKARSPTTAYSCVLGTPSFLVLSGTMETVLSAAQRGCSRVTLARCKRAYPQNIRPWSSTRAAHAYVPTHDVVNQVTPLENFNSALDTALLEAMERSGCEEGAVADVKAFGEKSGKREWLEKAHHANKHPPQLVTHDRFGNRVDCVEYQPTYHELMDHGLSHGVAAYAWQNIDCTHT